MVSHKKIAGLEISLGSGGLRFKKRPSGFNICVGKAMKSQPGPHNGGRYDKAFQQKFTAAVKSCSKPKITEQVVLEKAKPSRTRILASEPLLA